MATSAYSVIRDKSDGTVTVNIFDGAITRQKADVIARSMFVVPVKIQQTKIIGNREVRSYLAQGWL